MLENQAYTPSYMLPGFPGTAAGIWGLVLLVLAYLGTASANASVVIPDSPERVVFGGDAAYPPFEWLENGSPQGYNVDLAKTIARITGTRIEYRLDTWPNTVHALESGDVDIAPMLLSPEREEQFLFTTPFHYVIHAIYALDDMEPIYTARDLAQKRVAVEDRSYAAQQLKVENIGALVVTTSNTLEALITVEQGGADYAILAAPIADRLIQSRGLTLKRLGPPFWSRGYAFAVRKDRPELLNWAQSGMDIAIATGRYQEVYEQWQDRLNPIVDNTRSLRLAAFGLLGLLVLVAIIAIWSWSLRLKVRARTDDLRGALKRARAAELQARYLADYDIDTKLPKPHYFADLVDESLKSQSDKNALNKELLIIQLVELDEVVGTFGQVYSETLIRQFADGLSRISGGICGYFGRAVFVVFVNKTARGELFESIYAQRDPEAYYFHLVGGSAYYPQHGNDSVSLIRHAETALAHSFSNRQRWTLYDPSMEPKPFDLEIVSTFRDNKDLTGLYSVFQPQMDLTTGAVVAAEALVRWDHPKFGAIGPEKFVPLIEKAGYISRITAMMIDEAVGLASRLRHSHRPITISVNVAVADLIGTNLKNIIVECLHRHDGQATDLKLELTETSFASDSGTIKEVLDELSELGIRISIDDFGTGYSSLSYLSIFPVQELKIDRTFISDMVENERNCSIVRSTILLANQLGLLAVAEGAEREETVAMLKKYGCDRVQGYVFSKPLREAEFIAFVADNF